MNATAKVCESHSKSDNTCVLPQSSQKSTGKHITFESQDTIPCLDDKITCTIYKIYDGATDLITQVPNDELQYAMVQIVERAERNDYQEYFQYVITSCDLQKPRSWREGLELFNTLLDCAVNGSLTIYSLNTGNCGYLKMESTLLMVKGI